MATTETMSQLRDRFVTALRNLEGELSRELNKVRNEITRLTGAKTGRQTRNSSSANGQTVSILSGKICPKCGKKGHDMRWHRWNDNKKSRQIAGKKAA